MLAHLLQGQILDSRWAGESGRYLLKSGEKKEVCERSDGRDVDTRTGEGDTRERRIREKRMWNSCRLDHNGGLRVSGSNPRFLS